jgi:branched-chain amino acid transport system permease protein
MGLLLVATVLVAPEGLIVTSAKLAGRLGRGSKESA